MDLFVQFMAPIAIALFAFLVMWGIVRMITSRRDSTGDAQDTPADRADWDR